jgi:hypothetical protein
MQLVATEALEENSDFKEAPLVVYVRPREINTARQGRALKVAGSDSMV